MAILLSVGVPVGIAIWAISAARTERLSPDDLRWKNGASLSAPRHPISISYSQLGQARIKSAKTFVICDAPMPVVLTVTATPREYLRFERDPKVSFVINENGGVQAVKIDRTSGSPELDAKAVSLIEQTKYQQPLECVAKWSVRTTVYVDF